MDPRGIRNNNPGNLRANGTPWQGATGEEGGFVTFDQPIAGGRALIRTLTRYATKHGLNTVEGIIGRYAPPTENNTRAYVDAVAARLGVDPKDALDMTNPQTLSRLARSIAHHENGGEYFPPAFFDAATTAAAQDAPPTEDEQGPGRYIRYKPGGRAAIAQVFQETEHLPGYLKALRRTEAQRQYSTLDGDAFKETAARDEAAQRQWRENLPFMYEQDVKRLRDEQYIAGFGESFRDSLYHNTVTLKLAEMWQRGEPDPDFSAADAVHSAQWKAARIDASDDLRHYVLGSENEEDFQTRLADSKERLDLMHRASHAHGWNKARFYGGQFIGAAADPVAMAATVGTGAIVSAARGAAAAGRAAAIARGAGAAALENIAIGQALEHADNQPPSLGAVFEQGIAGAALGTVGGLITHGRPRAATRSGMPSEAQPPAHAGTQTVAAALRDAATGIAQDVVDRNVQRAWERGQVHGDTGGVPVDPTYSTHYDDLTSHRIDTGGAAQDRAALDREVTPDPLEHRTAAPASAEHAATPDAPAPTHGRTIPDELGRLARHADDPLIRTLASRLHEQDVHGSLVWHATDEDVLALTGAKGQAFYDPRTQQVHLSRAAPDAVRIHEIAHAATAAQLQRGAASPQTRQGRIRTDLDALRQEMQKQHGDAPDAMTQYYLGSVEEFVAGLYSGDSDFVRRLAATPLPSGGSLLSHAVRLIRDLLGLGPQDTNAFLKALDMSDRLIASDTPHGGGDGILLFPAVSRLPLGPSERRIKESLDAIGEQLDPAAQATTARAQAMMDKLPEWMDAKLRWAQSPGVQLARSRSSVARIAGSVLFENALGSGKRTGTVALNYHTLQHAYRDAYMSQAQKELVQMLTPRERLAYMLGAAQPAVDRISSQVAHERLLRRQAALHKQTYTSAAPAPVQRLAALMDAQIEHMVRDGLVDGNPYAHMVQGSGIKGFMPQVWRWDKFSAAQRYSPKTWEALRKNFTAQYTDMHVDPVIADLLAQGTDAAQVDATRARLLKQVEHQVNTRLFESIRDPNSRVSYDTGKFETMAAELLSENFTGTAVSEATVTKFRQLLADHLADRSRTEFDMLREVDGVRLMDYADHDMFSLIEQTAKRFAGQNAMAKAGFRTPNEFQALISLAQRDGATPDEVELLRFAGRAFGLLPLLAKDYPVITALGNFTAAAMLGKMGLSALADVASTVTAVGVSGMLKVVGHAFGRDSALVQQIAKHDLSLAGQDYLIQSAAAYVRPLGRAAAGIGEQVLRVSRKASQLVSHVSLTHQLNRMLHRGLLPVLSESLTRGIRGEDGGMTIRRMADAGLDGEAVVRIREQLARYEPNRQPGDAFHWEAWDDQQAGDQFRAAMSRIVGQVKQRVDVGEAPVWASEGQVGALVSQFHRFGMVATSKQLGRNLALHDANTYTAMTVGLAWASMLYYARLQANVIGMSKDEADAYVARNTEPTQLVNGILVYFNMSGIAADVAEMGEIVFGGNTYHARGGPAATLDYVRTLAQATNAVGNLATGQDGTHKSLRNVLRVLPGGNSLIGTYYSNLLKDEE